MMPPTATTSISRDPSLLGPFPEPPSPSRGSCDFLYHGLPCISDGQRHVVFSPYALKLARIDLDSLHLEATERLLRSQGFFGQPARPLGPTTTARFGLILTTGCNLRCKYCYIVPNTQARMMAPEYALRVLREKVTALTERISLSFFGGEPTLNMPALKAAVEYVKNLGLPYQFLINTNGTAPDEDLDYLIANRFIFIPSSDGPPRANDAQRRHADGATASLQIERTIQRLADAGCLFQVRATISAENVAGLSNAIHHWADLGARFVHIEPVGPSRTAQLFGIRAPEPEVYINAMHAALDEAEKRRVWIISSPYMNLLTPSTYFCTLVAGEKEMFTPDGAISACYRVQAKDDDAPAFLLGYHDPSADVFRRHDAAAARLRNIEVQINGPCKTCHARYVCAGGCPLRNLGATGDLRGIDAWSCTVKRSLVRDAVLRVAASLDQGRMPVVLGQSIFEGLVAQSFRTN